MPFCPGLRSGKGAPSGPAAPPLPPLSPLPAPGRLRYRRLRCRRLRPLLPGGKTLAPQGILTHGHEWSE